MGDLNAIASSNPDDHAGMIIEPRGVQACEVHDDLFDLYVDAKQGRLTLTLKGEGWDAGKSDSGLIIHAKGHEIVIEHEKSQKNVAGSALNMVKGSEEA